MFEGFANASRVPELRKRLGFTAVALSTLLGEEFLASQAVAADGVRAACATVPL